MRVTALVPFAGTNKRTTDADGAVPITSVIRELFASECVDEALAVTRPEVDLGSLVSAVDLLLVHDPQWTVAPAEIIRSVVDTVRSGAATAAVAALPVTDTIKIVEPGNVLRGTWDRHRLRAIQSPLCCRMALVSELGRVPTLADLPPREVRLVPGKPRTSSP